MISIYSKTPELQYKSYSPVPVTGESEATAICSSTGQGEVLIYVAVEALSSPEAPLEITFEFEDRSMPGEMFFKDCAYGLVQAFTVSPRPYRINTIGNFRLPLAVGYNENRIKVTARFINGGSGTVTVWVSPNSY